MVNLGDNVEGVVAAWDIATKEERHNMLHMILDAVYVDMATKEVVGIKPKSAFLPLFNLGEPIKTGEYVLATELTIGAADFPPSPRLEANSTNVIDKQSSRLDLISRQVRKSLALQI